MPQIILSFILLFNFCAAWGAQATDASELIAQARSKNIAQQPYWQALLHYHPTLFGTGIKSEITAAEFFLSPQGSSDAEAELAATLSAFFLPPDADADAHAQCRFIARYQWLRKVLVWRDAPPAVACKRFNAWTKHGHVDSASLIFATGYLSNPASFYGHILLKFNADRSVVPTNLLDESLNFGAIVPDGENPLRYMAYGLLGLYDSAFSSTGFYRLNHTYAEEELRDLWEYELALSPDQLQQISAHSWELLQARFDYYFFDKNCAYRMAELLALVVDEPLLSSLPWSVPSSVFDHLMKIQHDGKPLVRKVKRIPSRLNRYRDAYHQLNQNQQQIVADFVRHKQTLSQTQITSLSAAEQIAVVDSLRDYYQFLLIVDKENIDYKMRRRDLLIARATLPSVDAQAVLREPVQREVVQAPHAGSPAGLIRLGALQNNALGAGISMQLRPAYFDNLESDAGRLPNAHLSMFDLTATHIGNRWQVRNLDLVNIENLNVSDTPLPHDGGWAWRVKFGGMNANLACNNCLVANVTGGIGKAVKLGDDAVGYAMLDGIAQSDYLGSGTLATQPRLGILATPLAGWKTNLILSRRAYVNGTRSSVPQVQWENRFGIARDWDIRLGYNHNVASEWQAAISTYW